MNGLHINPKILAWSIERAGIDLAAVEKAFPQVNKWMKQEKYPSYRQLEDFAKKVRLPVGYFFLTNPPKYNLDIPFFRSLDDGEIAEPSPELIDSVHLLQRRQNWLREYLIENNADKLDFIGSEKGNPDALQIAKRMRERFALDKAWASKSQSWDKAFRKLLMKCEDLGINIVINGVVGNNTSRKLRAEEFRGFVLVDEYAPFLFINNSDAKAAQIFTLAHELAHLWLGKSGIFDLFELQAANDATELFCNQIAAEFLVPEKELEEVFTKHKDSPKLYQELAKHYKVSEIVIARRLMDCGLIKKEAFYEFYQNYLKQNRKLGQSESGGDFYENQKFRVGKSFMQNVVQAVDTGALQITEAFRLTGLYGNTFDAYKKSILG
ncbi:MAG: ImmA/IrrE family metallo-endopeptidase [Candidatus Cloacimonetes bacterium]|nr:ImmA/IrrE family metallo-endopeptidase [Candidatus Cloacimonadota bacterium]